MFMSIAELINKLPDATFLILLENQLLHHIAEFDDGELGYEYFKKLFTRQQKIMVHGRTEEGKALPLTVLRKWGKRNEATQKIFTGVRNGDENASKKMQKLFDKNMDSDDEDSDDKDSADTIKKTRPRNLTMDEAIEIAHQVDLDDLNKVTPWYKNKNGGRDLNKIWDGLHELYKGDIATILTEWDKAELRWETITGQPRQVFNRVVSVDRDCEKLENGGLHFHRNVAALRMALLWYNDLDCGTKLSKEEKAQLNKNDIIRFRNIYCLVYGIRESDDKWLCGLGFSILASNSIHTTMLRTLSLDSVRLILAVREEVHAVEEIWAENDEKREEVEKFIKEKTGFVDNNLIQETFKWEWAKIRKEKEGGGVT
ncbi:hypothetical protein HK104_007435, partial [Borealophlyctis nickersoniae]